MSAHSIVAPAKSCISSSSIFLCLQVVVGNFQAVHDGKRSQENLVVVLELVTPSLCRVLSVDVFRCERVPDDSLLKVLSKSS